MAGAGARARAVLPRAEKENRGKRRTGARRALLRRGDVTLSARLAFKVRRKKKASAKKRTRGGAACIMRESILTKCHRRASSTRCAKLLGTRVNGHKNERSADGYCYFSKELDRNTCIKVQVGKTWRQLRKFFFFFSKNGFR